MQTVLITGGSRGIGAATARAFARAGWRAAFTYLRSEAAARAVQAETGAEALRADMTDREAVQTAVGEAERRLGHLDALVLNAGEALGGLVTDVTAAEWERLVAVNLSAPFYAVQAAIPGMVSRKRGRIVFVSSMWGQVGASCEAAYSAAKAGLLGLSKALAKELGPSGVTVNCVCPGCIQTDMLAGYDAATRQALADETPLCRLGTPEEVAEAIRWLASDEAGFITGQTLGVNGGFVV